MSIGTQLFTIGGGKILASADGVSNDTPGDPDYPGEPSNWILLGVHYDGKPVSVLYQHLSPGHGMRAGRMVHSGDRIAKSGDSGNSSGPHLHFAAMHGWWDTATRYIYMQNDGDNPYVIFPPSKLWKGFDVALTKREIDDIADQTVDKLMRRKLFPGADQKPLRDVDVQDALRRTYLGHDDPAEVLSPAEQAALRDNHPGGN
jgi:murein DD-endopeptidase MepM/ murein hydrolase activator NlpD